MTLVKKYWPMALLALLVGLFSIMPLLFSLSRLGDEFQGIWPQFNSDANFYLARMHEVADGHPEMNNPYLAEHKDETYPQAIGSELFVAWLARVLHVSIPTLQVALTFIAPAVMSVLTYLLLLSLYPQRASAFVLTLAFFTVISGGMTKPINPIVSFPLLLLFLLSWFRLVCTTTGRWLCAAVCGIVLGLLFLTYFFHWSFLVVVLGIYGLFLFWRKDYAQFKYYAALAVIALLIGSPYLLRAAVGVETPLYEAMALRMGVFATHWPETFPRLGVALAWLAVFVFFGRRYSLGNDNRFQILLALLSANIIYPNHQVITGVTIENATHWSWMPVFLYAFAAHYLLWTIRDKNRVKRDAFNVAFVVLVAAMFIIPARRLQTFNFPPYQRSLTRPAAEESQQHYTAVLNWINSHADVDDVIFSHPALMRLVPVYTHANVYSSESMYYLLMSDTEAIERIILTHFFDIDKFADANFNMNEVARILWTQPAMIERNTHWMHDKLGIAWEPVYTLERELGMVRSVLSDLQQTGWDITLLRRYRLDYILWDKDVNPDWRLDTYDALEQVYEKNDIKVFTFKDIEK